MTGKLNPKGLGISTGIIGGMCAFLLTLFSAATGYGAKFLEAYASIHPGYTISIIGAFIGLVYSFICWFVVGYALAWLYNRIGKE